MKPIIFLFAAASVLAFARADCGVDVQLSLRTQWPSGEETNYLYDVVATNTGDDVEQGWYFKIVSETAPLNILSVWNLFHLGAGDATRTHGVLSPDSQWGAMASGSSFSRAGFITNQPVELDTVAALSCASSSASSSSPSSSSASEDRFCTQEIQECPDGSYVSRNPNNECAFDPCPEGSDGRVCTLELQECPDGSFVGRNPDNDCAFEPCPSSSSSDSGSAQCDVNVASSARLGATWNNGQGSAYQVYDLVISNTGSCKLTAVKLVFGDDVSIDSRWNVDDQGSVQNFGDEILPGKFFSGAGVVALESTPFSVSIASKGCSCDV